MRIVESKARSTLRLDDFAKYFKKLPNGDVLFNSGYFLKQPISGNPAVTQALRSNNLEI